MTGLPVPWSPANPERDASAPAWADVAEKDRQDVFSVLAFQATKARDAAEPCRRNGAHASADSHERRARAFDLAAQLLREAE